MNSDKLQEVTMNETNTYSYSDKFALKELMMERGKTSIFKSRKVCLKRLEQLFAAKSQKDFESTDFDVENKRITVTFKNGQIFRMQGPMIEFYLTGDIK